MRVLLIRSSIRTPGISMRQVMCAHRLHVVCFKAPWITGHRQHRTSSTLTFFDSASSSRSLEQRSQQKSASTFLIP